LDPETNLEMVELHVDSHPSFMTKQMQQQNLEATLVLKCHPKIDHLGQFEGLLSVGASQRMPFVLSNAGPYWMIDAEKHLNRKDSPSGKKIKQPAERVAIKLCVSRGRTDKLQIMCKQKIIPLEEELD
jgi:hypothetical protein